MVKQRSITVEVAYATVEKQRIIHINVAENSSIQHAIECSSILNELNIDLDSVCVGIFGVVCQLDHALIEGDRVEIYRKLLVSPMDARRNRAGKKA